MAAATGPLSDEKAVRMMTTLREGQTLRKFGVKAPRLEAYFLAHPRYAEEARPLIEANAAAAQLRKAAGKRSRIQCSRGHTFALETTRYRKDRNDLRRECKVCERERAAHGNVIKPGSAEQVRALLKRSARIGSFTSAGQGGYVMSHKTFTRLRGEDSEIDMLASLVIAGARQHGQHLRRVRSRNQATRDQNNDYHKIRAMLPPSFPDKDDVVSAIFEDLLTGRLRREDVRARIQSYITAHNRMFPTKYAKFGNSPLVSLDEVLFEDGTATRGDTVSRGLWD
jgi:hypothetical protein